MTSTSRTTGRSHTQFSIYLEICPQVFPPVSKTYTMLKVQLVKCNQEKNCWWTDDLVWSVCSVYLVIFCTTEPRATHLPQSFRAGIPATRLFCRCSRAGTRLSSEIQQSSMNVQKEMGFYGHLKNKNKLLSHVSGLLLPSHHCVPAKRVNQ